MYIGINFNISVLFTNYVIVINIKLFGEREREAETKSIKLTADMQTDDSYLPIYSHTPKHTNISYIQ